MRYTFCFVTINHRLTRSSLIKKKCCRIHFFLKTIDTVRGISYYVTLAFALNLVVGFWLREITHKFSRVFSISWAIFRNC